MIEALIALFILLQLCGWVVAFIFVRSLRPVTCKRCKHLVRREKDAVLTQYLCDVREGWYYTPPEYCRDFEPRNDSPETGEMK